MAPDELTVGRNTSDAAVKAAKETGIVKTGDKVVITAGVPLGVSGTTNQIRVVEA